MENSRRAAEPVPVSVARLIGSHASARPTAAFLEDARSSRVVDYTALEQAISSAAASFAEHGLDRRGAVVVAAADPIDFALAYLAAIAAGLRAVPVDPASPDEAITTLAREFDGAVLVIRDTHPAAPSELVELSSAELFAPAPRATERSGEATGLGSVSGTGSGIGTGTGTGTGTALLFTSGSTGTPKGVELSERQLLTVAAEVADNNRLGPQDRGYSPLPLFHVNAQVVALLATLTAGATLVLDRRFRRTGFWQLVAERRITWINAVPAILAILAKEPIRVPSSVRFIRSASAPLPAAVRSAFAEVPLVESYGMTEAASQITATPLDGSAPAGSVGRTIGAQLQIRDEQSRPLPAQTVGTIWLRGRGIVSSYFKGIAADRFDQNGWLRTGDLGSVDAQGWVTLVGRSDDVINRGGELVYPGEVEDVLLRDERVREAVVVGRPDPILGHVPVAFVIAAESGRTDAASLAAELEERCTRELPRALRPVAITVTDELPRAATGKVQRARLRAELEESAR